MDTVKKYLRNLTVALVALAVIIAAIHFPYDVDVPLTAQEFEAVQNYYTEAYKKPPIESQRSSEYETKYLQVSEAAAKSEGIEEDVSAFVERFNLRDRPVLDIGSGRGYLQDIAQNYTGLDISPSAARFYHKKFVVGSATAMPFSNNSFDGAWSVWVFEHVPNPEQAFYETRRVTREKGLLYLRPAWNCESWLAEGYKVRPYSDFGFVGKLIKASIPLRSSSLFMQMAFVPNRVVRRLVGQFGPTRLRYRRLTPNYETFWGPDSDAVNSIDSHEAMLWFLSRGDECLNCGNLWDQLFGFPTTLIIRIHKPADS
jgi:SAM-dependent methyltransferase